MTVHSFPSTRRAGDLSNIEQQLSKLPRRPQPGRETFSSGERRGDEEERRALQWRDRLVDSGPLFVAVGLRWASRVDLLPTVLRRSLAELAEPGLRPPPLSSEPRDLLAEALGRPPETLFHAFDPCPYETDLLFHRFRAELPHGGTQAGSPLTPRTQGLETVTVDLELARTGLPEALEALNLLDRAVPALETWLVTGDASGAEALVDSARRSVLQELDLEVRAEALEALGRDGASFFGAGRRWHAPRVLGSLSGSEVLATEACDRRSLDHRMGSPGPWGTSGTGEAQGEELARRICSAWLRQALFGSRLPAAPTLPNLAFGPSGRLRVLRGGFVRPSPAWQDRLAGYLEAVSAQDPDAILDALFALTEHPPEDRQAFHSKLSQMRPLRESEEYAPYGRFASQLLLHWRWIAEGDGRLEDRSVDFFCGVTHLESTLQRLAPQVDPWPAVLEYFRLEAELRRWIERLSPENLALAVREGASLLARGPSTLTGSPAADDGGLRIRLELTEEVARSLGGARSPIRVAVVFILSVAAALLALQWLGLDGKELASGLALPEPVRGVALLLAGLCLGALRR
ncbi:MAG: AarF/UbiB family protein [Acidobacteriota bacterium]